MINKALNEFKYLLNVQSYKPRIIDHPKRIYTKNKSAWAGLEKIIKDIIVRSECGQNKCLEFGVEFGYSTVAFSNYFTRVYGVDIFTGDIHAGFYGDIYESVQRELAGYDNISLIKQDYEQYIFHNNEEYFDLIHVDIVHTYEDTFNCGLWAANHSKCTLFHDTESFSEVKKAVYDISRMTKKTFYNFPHYNGLGILF